MNLVKFKDGKFGIRKGNWLFGYEYLDLVNPLYWWCQGSEFFSACRADEEVATSKFILMKDKGEVVK